MNSSANFSALSQAQHDECAGITAAALPTLASEVVLAATRLDRLLGMLNSFASCEWGCHGKEHIIEHLVGRTVSYARASLRLMMIGHYDESIALTRTIVETGNLLWLFFMKDETLREWADITDSEERHHKFGPGAVRNRLKQLGAVIPHDKSEYGRLCEIGIHPSPLAFPQSYNASDVPTVGGVFQERGFVLCLLTLSSATATVAGPAAKLGLIPLTNAEAIVTAAIELIRDLPDPNSVHEVTDSSDAVLRIVKSQAASRSPTGDG